MLVESISACFFEFYFLTQIDHFGKDNSLWKIADFKNGVISGIFGVFSSGFLHTTHLMC